MNKTTFQIVMTIGWVIVAICNVFIVFKVNTPLLYLIEGIGLGFILASSIFNLVQHYQERQKLKNETSTK